jgi:ankyrin repeat protein
MEKNNNIVFEYIKKKKWNELHNFINENIDFDINIKDNLNNYLLTYAILFNEYNTVKFLLSKNAKIDIFDSENRNILYIPIKFEYEKILLLLLDYNKVSIGVSILDLKDKYIKIPLHYAIIFKNINAIELLIKYGSNPNILDGDGYNSLHLSIYSRNDTIFDKVMNSKNINIKSTCETGENSLHIACNLNMENIVKKLLLYDIDYDLQDIKLELTPLHYAVHLNNINIVKLLLEKNINVNLQDANGNSVMHYAIIENNIEIVNIIIKKSQNINYNIWNINGEIPLHTILNSSFDNIDEYIELLIGKSNLTIQDSNGNTCLHLIILHKKWKKYKNYLENKRMDIFVKNNNGVMCINMIDKHDFDIFIDVIVNGYYAKLKENKYLWLNKWENVCAKENKNKNIKIPSNEIECKKKIKDNILKIYDKIKNNEKIECYDKSFPVKKYDKCIDLENIKNSFFSTFIGSTIDVLMGLIYLLKKHKNACSTLTVNFQDNKEISIYYNSIGIMISTKGEFLNFEILWINYKLHFIENFKNIFLECMNKKRFIIIPLCIALKSGNHANYLIYDKNTNEIERFETHGSNPPRGFNYKPQILDTLLETKFKEIDENIKYIKPSEYLPKIGFQILDINEHNNKKIGDNHGFCSSWAIWYTDMRLSYKNIDRKNLVLMLYRHMKNNNISFKNMIRSYTKEIIKMRDDILNIANIDINDWINDETTNKQVDIIVTEIKKEILNL